MSVSRSPQADAEAELAGTLRAALDLLDHAAAEAQAHRDPLQLPFRALAAFLRALPGLIERARQPVQDEQLQQAVRRGSAPTPAP